MRKNYSLQPVTAIAATGGGQSLDIRGLTRSLDVTLLALKSAGTNPTLAAKLQSSPPSVLGYSWGGVTTPSDNKIQTTGITKQDAAWTQSGAASISSVRLMLKKNGAIAAGKLVSVDIFADSAGAPTGSSLGTATIDIDSLVTTNYDLVLATFAIPVDVADATVYHLVLSANYTASDTVNVTWQGSTVASGGNQSTLTSVTWTAVPTVSLLLQMNHHVYTDVTSGGFTGLTTVTGRQTLTFVAENLQAHIRMYFTIGGTSSPVFYTSAEVSAESRTS